MFWEFVKSSLFFRIFYIIAGISFLYFYARNLNLFRFVDLENETRELNSKISYIKRIKEHNKTIHTPSENNDRLEKECNTWVQKNNALSNSTSLLSKEKVTLEGRRAELIAKNKELLGKLDEAKKINNEVKEEKQDREEEFKFIKIDIDELKNENEALKQKVK